MCSRCERKSKRLGIPKSIRFGQIKFFAHQLMRGFPIPLFADNRINYAIEAHVSRIRKAVSKAVLEKKD